jgi:hypothetical protein
MSTDEQEHRPGLFQELGLQVTVGLDVTPGGAADLPPEDAPDDGPQDEEATVWPPA